MSAVYHERRRRFAAGDAFRSVSSVSPWFCTSDRCAKLIRRADELSAEGSATRGGARVQHPDVAGGFCQRDVEDAVHDVTARACARSRS